MIEPCDHEWGSTELVGDGTPVKQCSKCPRWKLAIRPGPRTRNPERARRAMEDTARWLGEHRDV